VVWADTDGSDNEIFFYNGTTTTQLTNTDQNEYPTQISGSNIVWLGWTTFSDSNVFFYDGSQVKQVTNTYRYQNNPQVSGANIAWSGSGGSDGGADNEIFFANLARQDRFGFTVSDGAGGSVAGSFSFAIAEVTVTPELPPIR
jgi:serralysin